MSNENNKNATPVSDMPPSINKDNKTKSTSNNNNETSASSTPTKKTSSTSVPLSFSVPPIFPLTTSLPLNTTDTATNSTLASNLNKLSSSLNSKIPLTVNPSLNLKSTTTPTTLPLASNFPLLQNLQNLNNIPALSQLLLSMNMNSLDMSSLLPFSTLPTLNKQSNILPAATLANMQALMAAMNPAFAMANTLKNINPPTNSSKIAPNLKKKTPIKPNLASSISNNKSKATLGSKSPSSSSISSEKKKIAIAPTTSSSTTTSSSQTPLKPLSPKISKSTSTSTSGSAQTTNTTSTIASTLASLLNEKHPLALATPNLSLNPFFGTNPLLFPALAQAASTNPLLFGSLATGSNSTNLLNKLPTTKNQLPIIPTTSTGGTSSSTSHPRPLAPQSKKKIHIAPAVNPINQRQSILNSLLATAANLQALHASAGVPMPSATSMSKTPTLPSTLNLNKFNSLLNTNKVALSTTSSSTTASTTSSSAAISSLAKSTALPTSTLTTKSKLSLSSKDKNILNSINFQTMNSTKSGKSTNNLSNITSITNSSSKNISSNNSLNNKNTVNNISNSNVIKINDTNNKTKTNKRSPSSELALALSKLEDALKKNMKSPISTNIPSMSNTINTNIKQTSTSTSSTASALSALSALSAITNITTNANNSKDSNTTIADVIANTKTTNTSAAATRSTTNTTVNATDTVAAINNIKPITKNEFPESTTTLLNKNINNNITLDQNTFNLSHKDIKLKELSNTLARELNMNLNNEKVDNIMKPSADILDQISGLANLKMNQNFNTNFNQVNLELDNSTKKINDINPLIDTSKNITDLGINLNINNSENLLNLDLDFKESKKKPETEKSAINNKILESTIKDALSFSLINEDYITSNVNKDQSLNLAFSSKSVSEPTNLDKVSLISSTTSLTESPLEVLPLTFNLQNASLSLNDIKISKLETDDKTNMDTKGKDEKIEIGSKRKLNDIKIEKGKEKLTQTHSGNQEISIDEVFDSEQFSSEEDNSLKSTEITKSDFPSPKKKRMMRWEKASFSPFHHNRRDRISRLKNAVRSMSTGSINTTLLAADPTIHNQFSLDTKSPINKTNVMEITSPTNIEDFNNDYLNLNEFNSINEMNINHKHNNE
ncbi:hypothetical protein H8356DRAFT_1328145 [Neocallimastix lanati (nom. inval.)]|nr:hypothetical protein H8356DRAFT_1328145 [Neocallimastix sp. JGI-2020a]